MRKLIKHLIGACLFGVASYLIAVAHDDHTDAATAQAATYASGEDFIRHRYGFTSIRFTSLMPGVSDCAPGATRCYRWLAVDAQGRLVTGVISMKPEVITI